MRAAIYARVSSAGQRERHTIASQLRVLPDFARARGWELVGTYIDDGRTAKSGHLAARTGLAEMLRDAGAGKFDVLVVIDVDRLTRSEDLTERGAILGALQRAKVKVAIAVTGQVLDFSESMGDLFGSLQAFFAAEWGRKHRTRIMEGKLTAIARGKKPAGPTPYGYRYDRETGVWSIHEEEAAVVREVFDRSNKGHTGEDIARDLRERDVRRPRGGVWLRERVYQLLRQTAYRGEWVADKERTLKIAVPPIVTEEMWLAVRDREASRARRVKGLRRTKHVHLLESLAVCMLCGGRIGVATGAERTARGHDVPARYVCVRRRRPEGGTRCLLPYLRCDDVDARVWAAIREMFLVPGRLESEARKSQDVAVEDGELWRRDLAAAERRLQRLTSAEAAILARFRRGLVSEEAFDLELSTAKQEREQAKQQVEQARQAQFAAGRQSTRAAGLGTLVAHLRQRVDATTHQEKQDLVRALFAAGSIQLSIATIEMTSRSTPQSVGLVESTG